MSGGNRSHRFRFGVHQGLEYLTAALVVSTGIRLRTGLAAPVLGAGLAILTLAAVTDGPLCASRWLSRRAHAIGDGVLVAVLAAVPLVALDLAEDMPAAIVVWMAAAFLAFLATSTDYRPRPARRAAPRAAPPAPPPAPAPAHKAPPTGSPALNSAARAVGRHAGRAPRSLGRAVGRYKAKRTR
ncbi:MAG TPA: hypothetical protein VF045_05570 [Acidimicrobiales bacterium]